MPPCFCARAGSTVADAISNVADAANAESAFLIPISLGGSGIDCSAPDRAGRADAGKAVNTRFATGLICARRLQEHGPGATNGRCSPNYLVPLAGRGRNPCLHARIPVR